MTTSISISSMEMVPTFGRTFQQKETNPNSPELNTFEGILYSITSISGMDAFTFVKVSKLSEDSALEIPNSDRPQMIGHGIIKDGQVFISDLSQTECWLEDYGAAIIDDPDAILGATSLND